MSALLSEIVCGQPFPSERHRTALYLTVDWAVERFLTWLYPDKHAHSARMQRLLYARAA